MAQAGKASVLVTGAGSGIGLEVVRALLREPSVDVIAVARRAEDRLAAERRAHDNRLALVDADLEAPDAVQVIRDAVGAHRLLGLVHNAAVLQRTAFGAYTEAAVGRLLRLNLTVPLLLSQALADRLSGDPPGHIVHIGSMGGFQDSAKFPGLAAYSSSKAALACMAQCLAEELKDRGVRSNCLALGAVDTGMLRAAFPGYQAPVSASTMGAFIADFVLHGHKLLNGKVLPISLSTP